MELNAEQKACVEAIDGVWVAVSGPGTGKTTTLVQRHLAMLMRGISSRDILNLSFTSAAAEAMVKKVGLLDADKVFRTFHSFCMELLRQERSNLSFPLCDTVIPVGMEDYKLLFDLVKRYPAIRNFNALKEYLSDWKRQNIDPDEAMDRSRNNGIEYFYALAYSDYEKECREQGWLDFDSVMQETLALLESNAEVRAKWQRKYIAVDECQDTDVVQFRILQLLFNGNIFVVGDENQLIYEWRSAQSGNLTNFAQKFPGANTLYIGKNYRSTQKLVEFFKAILPKDNGIASRMMTDNEEGIGPVFKKYSDDHEEAYWVLAQITDPENTAILARTNRQLFIYHRICTMRSIKYKILGKKDFFDQNEVRKLLTYAKEVDSNQPAAQVLKGLIEKHRMLEVYKHSVTKDSNPIENLNSVVTLAGTKGGTIKEFIEYLRKRSHGRKNAKGLTLSTVHQAKGREWENVFIVGAEQGRMPHKDGELEEETRIFYVAATRAAHLLHISYSGRHSMFLEPFKDQIQNLSNSETL
jgi:DNA helicase-2/ATP-dependent DNA helicase PcrA